MRQRFFIRLQIHRWTRAFAVAALFSLVVAVILSNFSCEHDRSWRGGQPPDAGRSLIGSRPSPAVEQEARTSDHGALLIGMAPPAEAEEPIRVFDRSRGCMTCHGFTDSINMHNLVDWERAPDTVRAMRDDPRQYRALIDQLGRADVVAGLSAKQQEDFLATVLGKTRIGCVDCHGGRGDVRNPLDHVGRPNQETDAPITDASYLERMRQAHVQPRNPEAWYGRDQFQDAEEFGKHVKKDSEQLHGSRNPENTTALLNQESPQFIRFINPGDLRVATFACASCHNIKPPYQVQRVPHSMMAQGPMLWGAALYNNGSVPHKVPRYSESYSLAGHPESRRGVLVAPASPLAPPMARNASPEERSRGVLDLLVPLPPWNVTQPGNVLRIFERGTRLPVVGTTNPAEIGNPNVLQEGGKPDKGLSVRGLGTLNRTDPVFLGLQKTRLLDPTLNFLGTNDHPGDYRSSGCTACHTVYANDRDPIHSGTYAQFGHTGRSWSADPTIPKQESGHPVKHILTRQIPTSQCVVCHIHPGTSYANSYLGYMWWDNESDGRFMYPAQSQQPTARQQWQALRKNPEAAQLRGLWGNLYPDATSHAGEKAGVDFLERTGEPRTPGRTVLNDKLEHNQFADFHGHGWVFRAVFKKNRKGQLVDRDNNVIDPEQPDKWKHAVHLKDIHLERGMHCVDCHFSQDVHGDGRLYGEVRNAIEITCIDCHGDYTTRATLLTSGPAAPVGGTDLVQAKRFALAKKSNGEIVDRRIRELLKTEPEKYRIVQQSAVDPKKFWVVPQTIDTVDPSSDWYNADDLAAMLKAGQIKPEEHDLRKAQRSKSAQSARYSHSVRADGKTWGTMAKDDRTCDAADRLAHTSAQVSCYTCHTSWMTSCFGCHLSMKANERTPMLHNENLFTRNFTQYNFQVLRDDIFMIGRDSPTSSKSGFDKSGKPSPGKIVPVRSSSAVIVSSQNQNREWVYHQQQTVSAEGYSGQAFNPHYPHAVSGAGTTKTCVDCHISREDDNNAWMAQLLLQGTNFVNFFGRYVYVGAGGHGLSAVAVTEHDEPQAVYGSNLHSLAYPDEHHVFDQRDRRQLKESYHHDAGLDGEILDVQLRGEYLYAARGRGGFYVYDVANIDNKGFSERIVTAPVSPLGQRLGFRTRNAVVVASPSTLALDPGRLRWSPDPETKPRRITEPAEPGHVNQEQTMHSLYAYLYIGDSEEGLILTNAATLLDGDPQNNFLERAKLKSGGDAFNPGGVLTGLRSLVIAGHYVYATSNAGLVVVNINDPLAPLVVGDQATTSPSATIGGPYLRDPKSVAVQFRFAFITDADGLKVVDITDPERPRPATDDKTFVPLASAGRIYVARNYAFVACGEHGLAIIDVQKPREPKLLQMFTADGKLTDVRDVKVGMTYASLYAYVADGKNGLRVLELMGPHTTQQFRGFSPPLSPRLIATYPTSGPALAISKGLDRDRAVDESGNQVAVFGRVGARPLTWEEMKRLLYTPDGQPLRVSNEPDPAFELKPKPKPKPKPVTPEKPVIPPDDPPPPD